MLRSCSAGSPTAATRSQARVCRTRASITTPKLSSVQAYLPFIHAMLADPDFRDPMLATPAQLHQHLLDAHEDPALIDTTTGKVVNNDYNWLTTYFEVNFRPWHKKGAPELYPVELREEIDKMNLWLFDNINNAVYRSSFSRSNEGHFDGVNTFYAAMDRLEKRLETNRFLFGDYVTDSDIRLYVTLARLDIRYTAQLGETKRPLYTYKNLWGYAKELWEIPAFAHHTDFAAIIRQGRIEGEEDGFRASTHYDLALPKIDWDAQWKVSTERAYLSSDPTHPIYLGNNRRFDIDPTWYDLGAESPKKEEKETPPSCGCCCG